MLGAIIIAIDVDDDTDEIVFELRNGEKYKMYHEQDCCESVYIEDINGDLDDLINTPLLIAEEAINPPLHPSVVVPGYDQSYTWTFYKFGTLRGYVTIRWFGNSNGYYSESVDFAQIQEAR